ncbi:MAG: aspartate aminotransferase family protein [Acidobacteria bacterium]|nr:aspartate aminotransferase family protein [Acidobacteriota bacterium]
MSAARTPPTIEEVCRLVTPARAAAFRACGFPLVQGRREGSRLYDLQGRPYVNCRSSGGVFNFGHRPAFAVEALRGALDHLDIGDWLVPSPWRAEAASRISDSLPGGDWMSFFVPGGGEAVDVAIKLARLATGRTGFVCAEGGYHGHTGFALSAGDPCLSEGMGPLVPGFERVAFGDAAAVERATGPGTAAVLLETIPATGGMLVPPDDFYPRVRAACDRAGALLILDEVQAGLGRTGKIWGFENWDVVPDIVITGKGLSGGVYPVSACTYRADLERALETRPFFHPSSYGGAELGMVVAAAVMDEVRKPGFLEHVRAMGERFQAGFDALRERHPDVLVEFRRRGLMMGYDLPSPVHAIAMLRLLLERGVLSVFSNNRPFSMQLMPALVISPEDVDFVLEAAGGALEALEREVPATAGAGAAS